MNNQRKILHIIDYADGEPVDIRGLSEDDQPLSPEEALTLLTLATAQTIIHKYKPKDLAQAATIHAKINMKIMATELKKAQGNNP